MNHLHGEFPLHESQTVKNSESIAFQAIESLSKSFMVLLTGTPFENSMKDLWSLFSLLSTDLLGTSENFLGPFMTGDNSIVQRALKRNPNIPNAASASLTFLGSGNS
ncbi:hypothetical protein ACTFIW_005491 [Dictyostelium discoideum]